MKRRRLNSSLAVITAAAVAPLLVPAQAQADPLPAGCAGAYVYVCSGDATPPGVSVYPVAVVPVEVGRGATKIFDPLTTPAVPVGGVVIPVGGPIYGGYTTELGGPTSPMNTGLVMPTTICVFVTCLQSGEPIIVPSLPLPVVPVVIPPIAIPNQTVNVPVVATLPEQVVPGQSTPAVYETVGSATIYMQADQEIPGLSALVAPRQQLGQQMMGAAADMCTTRGGRASGDYWDYSSYWNEWFYTDWKCTGSGPDGPYPGTMDLLISSMFRYGWALSGENVVRPRRHP